MSCSCFYYQSSQKLLKIKSDRCKSFFNFFKKVTPGLELSRDKVLNTVCPDQFLYQTSSVLFNSQCLKSLGLCAIKDLTGLMQKAMALNDMIFSNLMPKYLAIFENCNNFSQLHLFNYLIIIIRHRY